MASCANPTLTTATTTSHNASSRNQSRPSARRFAGRSKGKRRSTTRPLILDNVLCDLTSAQNGIVSLTETAVDKLFKKDPIEHYYIVEQAPFASGLFATVHQCHYRSTGEMFAAKYAAKLRYGTDCTADILHEVALMALCSTAPGIVHLRDVFDTPTHTILVMDYAPGGDLQTVLDDDMVPYEKDAVKFIRQLLEGLVFLHDKNIAHLDIKPQNLLLLGSFPDCDIQLCDLEISRVILEGQEVREILGTPDYVPPEILQFEPISLAADVWSVGVMAYVLLTGFTPFGGDSDKETFYNICHGKIDFPPELFEDISHHAEDFIRRLLVRQPSVRPTVRECLKHPWLASWKKAESHKRDTVSSENQRKSHATNNGYSCPRSLTSLGSNVYLPPSSTMPHALQRSMSKSREVLYEKVAASNLRKSTSKSRERLWEMTFTLSRSKDFLFQSPTPSKSKERLHDLRNMSKSQEVLSLQLFSEYNHPLLGVLSPSIPLTRQSLDRLDPSKSVQDDENTSPKTLTPSESAAEELQSHPEDTSSSTETLCAVPLADSAEQNDANNQDQCPGAPATSASLNHVQVDDRHTNRPPTAQVLGDPGAADNVSCPHMVVKVEAIVEKPVDMTSKSNVAAEPNTETCSVVKSAATKPTIPPKPKLKPSPSPLILTFTPLQSTRSDPPKSPISFEFSKPKNQASSPSIKHFPKTPPMVLNSKFTFYKEKENPMMPRSSTEVTPPNVKSAQPAEDVKPTKLANAGTDSRNNKENQQVSPISCAQSVVPQPTEHHRLERKEDKGLAETTVGSSSCSSDLVSANPVALEVRRMENPQVLDNETKWPLELHPSPPSPIIPAEAKDKDARVKTGASSSRPGRLGSVFDTAHLTESDRNLLPKVLTERRASWAYGAHAEDTKVSVSQIITSFNKGEPLSIPSKPTTPLKKSSELEAPALLIEKSSTKPVSAALRQIDKPSFPLKGPKIPLTPPVSRRGISQIAPRTHTIISDLKALPRLPEDAVGNAGREQALLSKSISLGGSTGTIKERLTANATLSGPPAHSSDVANDVASHAEVSALGNKINKYATTAAEKVAHVIEEAVVLPNPMLGTEIEPAESPAPQTTIPDPKPAVDSTKLSLERSSSLTDALASTLTSTANKPPVSVIDVLVGVSVLPPEASSTGPHAVDTLLRSGSLSSDTGCSELSSDALSDQSSTSWDEGKAEDRSDKGEPPGSELSGSDLNWKGRPRSFSVQTDTICTSQPWGRVCTGSLARALEKFNAKGSDNPPPEGFNRFRRQSTPGFKHS